MTQRLGAEPGRRGHRRFSLSVRLHLAVVAAAMAVFTLATVGHDPDDGANIGQGAAYLVLGILALPWSALTFLLPSDPVFSLILATGILLNVVVHVRLLGRHR